VEEKSRRGSSYKYFRYKSDDAAELKSSKLLIKIVDIDGLSQLPYPTQLDLYSTHRVKKPLIGKEMVWIEGVRNSNGITYLNPTKATAVQNSDRTGFYFLGLIFLVIGLGVYLFLKPKKEG